MDNYYIQLIFQLGLAVVLGAVIGLEREKKGKEAGFQTYSLVTLGSCLFTIVSFELFGLVSGQAGLPAGQAGISFDPSRVIQAIAIGIGFIGGGVIIYNQFHLEGVTTAAGLWCASAIGIAVGAKLYFLALTTVVLAAIILAVFGLVERKIFNK